MFMNNTKGIKDVRVYKAAVTGLAKYVNITSLLVALRYIVRRRLPPSEQLAFFGLVLAAAVGAFGIVVAASNYYAEELPTPGGAFTEGIVGTPRFINPLIAVSDSERDIVALVYAGLLRPDGRGGLVPALAERYTISDDGLTYTFVLREDARWHDNKPVTSDDVVFTVREAKNPMLKSPKRANWEGVEAEAVDGRTVRFQLQRPYAPFLENALLGILPKHLWQEATAEQMALSDFNIRPIGAGPYRVQDVSRNSSGIITSYALRANDAYVLGSPHIRRITLKFYPSETALVDAYERGEVDSMSVLAPQRVATLQRKNGTLRALNLPRVFAVFLNQNTVPAFAERPVRKALLAAVDREELIKNVFAGHASALNSPIPPGTFGALEYTDAPGRSLEEAATLLRNAGWKREEKSNVWEKQKRGQPSARLAFSLTTSNVPELVQTAEFLQRAWKELGADVSLRIFEIGDLNQRVIRPREYATLLFGEVVGLDPDPFAFWHSSQRNDPGLNIALYANIAADRLLEEARTLADAQRRKATYEKFQQEVQKDVPAIFLYSPQYLYVTTSRIKGFNVSSIAIPSDRFSQVHEWFMQTRRVL
jgi:peptide/nickel transport system substrate-binding protein